MLRLLFLSSFFLCLIKFESIAQIVNIENQRLSTKTKGFTGSIDLNVNYTMNTIQLLQIGDRARIAYNNKRHHYLLLTDHSFVRTSTLSIVNLAFEHIRYNYDLKDSGNFSIEFYEQAQFNKIQKINARVLLGTGIRYHILDFQNYQLNIGTGFMFEYEELIGFNSTNDILNSSYFSFDGQYSEHIGMNFIMYYQPRLVDTGNYRLSLENQWRFKINKHLTYRIIYSLTHDSRNIPDVRKTNYIFKNALSFTF